MSLPETSAVPRSRGETCPPSPPEEDPASSPLEPWSVATELLWQLQACRSVPQVLSAVTSAVREVVPVVQHAGVALGTRAEPLRMVVATSTVARSTFDVQAEVGAGPCLHAHRTQQTVLLDRQQLLATWPELAVPLSGGAGIRSILSLPLRTPTGPSGVLSLLTSDTALTDADARAAALLASATSFALASQEKTTQFEEAVQARDVIGQAKGMLMRRFGLSADAAFQLLVRVSQTRHVKLRRVAALVVEAGDDPTILDLDER